jgi:hypothetical protein
MKPEPKQFVIREVGSVRETSNGNRYVTCNTDLGRVAFWGSADNSRNIRRLQTLVLPASVRAGCISSKWSQHALWIPETAEVLVISGSGTQSGTEDARRSKTGSEEGPRNEDRRGRTDQKTRDNGTFDAHSVLGVAKGATAAEIRAAYLACIKLYHPDRVAHLGHELRELANQKTPEINRAYKVLTGRKT